MKKIILFLACMFFVTVAFADRNTATVTTYNSSQLVQRGEGKIYSASFVASANNGEFIVLDAVSNTVTSADISDVVAEGGEATSKNSQYQNFSDKPIEIGTGIYVVVTGGYLTLRYE